ASGRPALHRSVSEYGSRGRCAPPRRAHRKDRSRRRPPVFRPILAIDRQAAHPCRWEDPMSIAASFLPEFDAEMAATRRLLERVPAEELDWKPHPKSRSLGELATHVTELPRWAIRFEKESFQVGSEKAPPMPDAAAYLARFDENASAARAAIARASDEWMQKDFTVLKADGQVFFTSNRQSLIRRVLLNHLIHHRGQLTVYMRELDRPLPAIYGPTADEGV